MNEKRVLITKKDHVAIVSFNRPEKMNSLDVEQFKAIIAAGEEINEDPTIRAVVLKGAGKAFCAGLDVNALGGSNELMDNPLEPRTHGICNTWQQAVWVWRDLQVPVIAAVHGFAIGGGLQIMLGADIKYITADTKLSIMEMKWGMIPDMAGTQLLYHNVRQDIIKELTFTNRMFSGKQAVEYGFATHLSETPAEDALKLAEEIATKNPHAIVKAKQLLNDAAYHTPESGLMNESLIQAELLKTKNQLEAVYSSMQKRPGNFDNFRD